jgi:putative peptidoglycan lipid II flippase
LRIASACATLSNEMTSPAKPPQPAQTSIGKSAFLVAAGIFLSRISGLVRDRIFGHYFGLFPAADAYRAALRIPNFLQNLFGEGALSASFIPVYARLVAEQKKEDAGRVAGAIFSLLALAMSALVLIGVLAAPLFIDIIAPGFHDPLRRNLTIQLVRIFFPGIGLLVLSAWCLGILNSHGKFFLSYVSPVVWNAAIIAALVIFGRNDLSHLAVDAAWGAVIGSGLQFLVQLPTVLKLAPGIKLLLVSAGDNVGVVLRNFLPTFVARGVNQLSAYVDNILASFLPEGTVAALFNAQTLSLLPVSLFGMAISAAELPAMSRTLGEEQDVAAALRGRIAASTRRIGFFVVPSAMAFLALGDVVAGVIYQTGNFHREQSIYVWKILAGSAIGLVASTVGRLYSSAYYALRDTRTPLRFAIVRVILTTGLGYLCALPLPRLLGIDPSWGAVGLTASAGLSAWVEFTLLRRSMHRRIGPVEFPFSYFARLWVAGLIAAAAGWGMKFLVGKQHPLAAGGAVLVPYGAIYLGLTMLFKIDQGRALFSGIARRFTRPQPGGNG